MSKQVTSSESITNLFTLLKQVQLDLDAEEIADLLWLALQMSEADVTPTVETPVEKTPTMPLPGENKEAADIQSTPPPTDNVSPSPSVPAVLPRQPSEKSLKKPTPKSLPFKAPTAPGLRNLLELGRALRPLMRKVPSQTKTVLDEEETVTQFAEKGVLIPVLKPAPERWLNLALVVEESRSITIWQEIIAEFQKLTELQGAFRYVSIWRLTTDDNGEIKLFSQYNLSANKQHFRSPKELLDPAGRRLILLISDCTSGMWRDGQMWRDSPTGKLDNLQTILKSWSDFHPFAIVQLLPERLWMRTAMGFGFPVQLNALAPGVPNRQLIVDGLPAWEDVDVAQAITVPVITLEPEYLQQWSRVVAGVGSTRTVGILFEPGLMATQPQMLTDATQLSAIELVNRFRATASPIARRLAGLMAAVPVSLPVVHLIQETMLDESRQVHVAEIFMSGLLEPITSNSTAPKGEIVQYEFVEGVRELFIDSVPIPNTKTVLDNVSQYIANRVGREIKSFKALLSLNADWDETTKQEIIPFAKIGLQALRRLGGEHADLAEELERKLQVSNNFPLLQTFTFEVATIIIEDDTETLPDINLQPFEFEVARIEVNQSALSNTKNLPEIVDVAIFNKTGKHLNDIEQLVIEGTLFNQTYENMSSSTKYSKDHLRSVGNQLWRTLSELLGEKVTKKNLKNALKHWVARSHLTIHRHQQQATGFIENLGNSVQLEMVSIPGGSFIMGSPEGELERSDDESPQREVSIKPFHLGKYQVTQAQWQAVAALPQINHELDPDPSDFKGENRPIENVSWDDAVEFCSRLSQYTGRPYRLPSEAEWEYACRAGTITPFHFGETITTDLANYDGTDNEEYKWSGSYGQGPKGIYRKETTDVGSFGVANNFGLYDMHGNVWEWCADHWHDNYEGAPTDGSAWLSDNDNDNQRRMLRGGSWFLNPGNCRSAYRSYNDAGDRFSSDGFRVACSAAWTL